MITRNPTDNVIGNPIPYMFSCGADRVSMPNAILVINSAAIIGIASCTPVLKINPPQLANCKKPCPLSVRDMGRVVKLVTNVSTIIKWPLIDRKINVESMVNSWLTALVCPCVCGS